MILATALLASSLLTAAAEARGGGAVGGFGREGAVFGSGRAYFEGTGQNAMRRFDVFDRDYDPSCDNDWQPKQMWASSCS
jgi:hypothetical protein